MDDQRELSNFVRKLHHENNSKHKVIGSRLCYYSFKVNHKIDEELYEGQLHLSFGPHGPPINVVFVKVAQEDAEIIFRRTAAVNDGVVLRPWMHLFSKQKEFDDLPEDTDLRKGIWVLCYDRFEHDLKHWTNMAKPEPKGIAYNDKLKLPIKTGDDRLNEFWCNSIRKLIDGVCDIHKEGLYHGGLSSQSNYAFYYKSLKIINIKGSLDTLNDEQCEAQKKEDITDLLWMLNDCYDDFAKKVLGDPFLLKADQRMRLFDHYDTMRNCPTTAQHVNFALALSAFDNFKSWNSTSTLITWIALCRVFITTPHQKKKKQQKKASYFGTVSSLRRYLRNLNHHYQKHGLAAGSLEDVDRGVTTHFRGFLELLYRHLEL
ncbi:leucine-rich repeat receptor-like protein kinase PXL2 [Prunus yedoensis var. nudiflora]|uniref:Leucine-rich repeat receptor-like protein kinase PXL2 n=1 Tax=Prunus yedoensis var. nudiflora TaxID=2094558 RepID=A0A314XZD8_PRUYE|nr:leucine-rich repeat receptor-like protein kinase PXL2 [Prunus yedoensis var. nudiflora]